MQANTKVSLSKIIIWVLIVTTTHVYICISRGKLCTKRCFEYINVDELSPKMLSNDLEQAYFPKKTVKGTQYIQAKLCVYKKLIIRNTILLFGNDKGRKR